MTDDQGLSITLINGVDVDLNLEDPRGDRDRIESYLDDNNIDYDDLSLDIDYEEQYLEEE